MTDVVFKTIQVVVICFLIWWIFRSATRQKAESREGDLIFPVARGVRVTGALAAALGALLAFGWWIGVVKDGSPYIPMGFVLFSLLGIWSCIGEVRLNKAGIEKRFLWRRKAIAWQAVLGLRRTRDGRTVIYGDGVEISFSPYYADYDGLLREIRDRAPALKAVDPDGSDILRL